VIFSLLHRDFRLALDIISPWTTGLTMSVGYPLKPICYLT